VGPLTRDSDSVQQAPSTSHPPEKRERAQKKEKRKNTCGGEEGTRTRRAGNEKDVGIAVIVRRTTIRKGTTCFAAGISYEREEGLREKGLDVMGGITCR